MFNKFEYEKVKNYNNYKVSIYRKNNKPVFKYKHLTFYEMKKLEIKYNVAIQKIFNNEVLTIL